MSNMAAIPLQKEFDYYINNQEELLKKYSGQFIVIKNQIVIGAFPSIEEAYNYAIKIHELGTFLIQECLPGSDSYSQTYRSRVHIG